MMKRFSLLLIIASLGIAIFSGSEIWAANKSPEVSMKGQSVAERDQVMSNLHARLSAFPRASERYTVDLTAEDSDILAKPSMDSTGRFRVGVHRAIGKSVLRDNTDLIVSVPGAPAIRLELSHVKGTVAVFNDTGQAHEYTEDGFTHTFLGEEVRVRGAAHIEGAGAVNLGGNLCVDNAPCTENAACVSIHPDIDDARDAYASILFISGPYYYVCTGGLIADSDTNSEVPYFLTANHCVSKEREAQSLETFFKYVQKSCQAGECSLPPNSSTTGSTIVATNRKGDYSLLQLSQSPPAGTVYLGWNDTPVAFNDENELYRISHPGGAPQAYSEHTVDTSAVTCRSWPRGDWIYSRDIFGATEGGSSGSPVMNAQAEVVGQLSGACGYNVNDVCDEVNNATVDGAFAAYYSEISQYLASDGGTDPEVCNDSIDNDGDGLVDCDDEDCAGDPVCDTGGECTDADGDGWCLEEGDCNDEDPTINPGAKDRGGPRWSDGIDNDCDGKVDR